MKITSLKEQSLLPFLLMSFAENVTKESEIITIYWLQNIFQKIMSQHTSLWIIRNFQSCLKVDINIPWQDITNTSNRLRVTTDEGHVFENRIFGFFFTFLETGMWKGGTSTPSEIRSRQTLINGVHYNDIVVCTNLWTMLKQFYH
jgi:hypothetical protein